MPLVMSPACQRYEQGHDPKRSELLNCSVGHPLSPNPHPRSIHPLPSGQDDVRKHTPHTHTHTTRKHTHMQSHTRPAQPCVAQPGHAWGQRWGDRPPVDPAVLSPGAAVPGPLPSQPIRGWSRRPAPRGLWWEWCMHNAFTTKPV